MAEREITLTMTPAEEAALSRLIAFVCNEEVRNSYLSGVFGVHSPEVDLIGTINAAINSNR